MFNDPLASALSKIMNAERRSKKEILVRPASKMIKTILTLMNENNYLGSFEESNDGKGNFLKINLLSNINKCGVIKPRFSTQKDTFEKWEKRYLPAKDFGIILISTPQGIMTHYEAKKKEIGGKLLAYCY
ncbi:MAG: 30S ribosomal protein S8 [Candidatus Woesearchaeota archaeon]